LFALIFFDKESQMFTSHTPTRFALKAPLPLKMGLTVLIGASLFLPSLGLAQEAVAPIAESAGDSPGFFGLLFSKGGLVTWIIALLSAVGLPVAAVKIYQFYQMDIYRPQQLDMALADYRAGKIEGLAKRLDNYAHPAAPLIGYALTQAHGRTMSPDILREELARRAQYLVRHRAYRGLRPPIWRAGHGSGDDCRFPRRRPRRQRGGYGFARLGHLGSAVNHGVWVGGRLAVFDYGGGVQQCRR
jgi:hypothetical protein